MKQAVSEAIPQSQGDNPNTAVSPAAAEGNNEAPATTAIATIDLAAKQLATKQLSADASVQSDAEVTEKPVVSKKALPPSVVAQAQEMSKEIAGQAAVDGVLSNLAEAGDSPLKKAEVDSASDSAPADSDPPVDPQNPATEPTPFAPAKAHGTSVAKLDMPMKKAAPTNKIAGFTSLDEKVLPGETVSLARADVLSVRGANSSLPSRVESSPTNAVVALAVQESSPSGAQAADEPTVTENISSVRSQALDHTHDLIMQQTLRLVDMKSESLHVVLMPEAGTKLSLELRQRGNNIEAQAVVQSGNFEHLRQHWPELQQRLELRGVKLSPLTSEDNSLMWSGDQGSKNQFEQSAEPESVLAGALAGLEPVGVRNNLPAEPAMSVVSSHGWQTWA